MYRSATISFFALLVLHLAASGWAADREPAASLHAHVGQGATRIGDIGYATGFEPPQFVPASVVGQGGWGCTPEAIVSSLITPFNPDTGLQQLRLIDNPGVSNNTLSAAVSPTFSPLNEATVSIRYSINNVQPGVDEGAAYQVVPQSSSLGLVVTRIVLSFTGDILVLDDLGGGPQFVDTGFDWTPDVYHTLAMTLSNNRLEYFHDGVPIYLGNAIAAPSIDQFALVHDNFELPDESADFDNLSITIVPEPAAIAAAISLCAISGAQRRRK